MGDEFIPLESRFVSQRLDALGISHTMQFHASDSDFSVFSTLWEGECHLYSGIYGPYYGSLKPLPSPLRPFSFFVSDGSSNSIGRRSCRFRLPHLPAKYSNIDFEQKILGVFDCDFVSDLRCQKVGTLLTSK